MYTQIFSKTLIHDSMNSESNPNMIDDSSLLNRNPTADEMKSCFDPILFSANTCDNVIKKNILRNNEPLTQDNFTEIILDNSIIKNVNKKIKFFNESKTNGILHSSESVDNTNNDIIVNVKNGNNFLNNNKDYMKTSDNFNEKFFLVSPKQLWTTFETSQSPKQSSKVRFQETLLELPSSTFFKDFEAGPILNASLEISYANENDFNNNCNNGEQCEHDSKENENEEEEQFYNETEQYCNDQEVLNDIFHHDEENDYVFVNINSKTLRSPLFKQWPKLFNDIKNPCKQYEIKKDYRPKVESSLRQVTNVSYSKTKLSKSFKE